MNKPMRLVYIWYKDQQKAVIEHKVGRKYSHYLIMRGTGVTTVRIPMIVKTKPRVIKQDLKKAATSMLVAGERLGITKTATKILERIIHND
jgi:hypothetical protein|tara:strand:+ start:1191 stop:1463 length:273 start_codon:yes stop_codon:yes gene_type:complete